MKKRALVAVASALRFSSSSLCAFASCARYLFAAVHPSLLQLDDAADDSVFHERGAEVEQEA
ncbi:MAG: hypothetical protein WBM40_17560 [Thiohalocapsa sp.]